MIAIAMGSRSPLASGLPIREGDQESRTRCANITLDGYAASHYAAREMKTDKLLPEDTTQRSSQHQVQGQRDARLQTLQECGRFGIEMMPHLALRRQPATNSNAHSAHPYAIWCVYLRHYRLPRPDKLPLAL